jgi:CheY-like chemotaxis protein
MLLAEGVMKKVLLASAYMLFLKRNTTLLMRRGFRLFTAASGADAFKLHKEHNFDLILLDFKLEEMSGCTFCHLLRKGKASPQVPLIMTCHNIPGSIESAEQCGADVVLTKPIGPLKLIEIIGSYLGLTIGRNKRVVLEVNVVSKIYGAEFACLSHDISNTGMLIETDCDLALESHIVCQFSLPNICRIETEAVITRFMTKTDCKNLYGVKFVALPLSARKNIDNFIASMPAPSYAGGKG